MLQNRMMIPFVRNGRLAEPSIDQWFSRTFDTPSWLHRGEINELDDRAEVRLEVPGVKPEQIQVTAEHRTLTVRVQREGHEEQVRQYTVSPQYDLGQVQARLELGVLTLSLPKAPEAKARQVPVAVG
jgi:HSP20 family molecular chaperone IbpA